MKKLLLVTDAWHPLVNGVVRAYDEVGKRLRERGIEMVVVHPGLFYTMPLPLYPEIRLALFPRRRLRAIFEKEQPDFVHIAAEGPLGWSGRNLCRNRGWRYTTAYHTHFQRHLDARVRGFTRLAEWVLWRFHTRAAHTMVATETLKQECRRMGFEHIVQWPLGVDTDMFAPSAPSEPVLQRPVLLFFSRLAAEKSPEEFFDLDMPGTKLVVGDGPERARLERKYPAAMFVGYKHGRELAEWISRADVLVYPSRTETFGLAIVEALSCGVPVAAHDEPGPRDILTHGTDGYLGEDLRAGVEMCLKLDRHACRQKALTFSWEASADAFVRNLVPVR